MSWDDEEEDYTWFEELATQDQLLTIIRYIDSLKSDPTPRSVNYVLKDWKSGGLPVYELQRMMYKINGLDLFLDTIEPEDLIKGLKLYLLETYHPYWFEKAGYSVDEFFLDAVDDPFSPILDNTKDVDQQLLAEKIRGYRDDAPRDESGRLKWTKASHWIPGYLAAVAYDTQGGPIMEAAEKESDYHYAIAPDYNIAAVYRGLYNPDSGHLIHLTSPADHYYDLLTDKAEFVNPAESYWREAAANSEIPINEFDFLTVDPDANKSNLLNNGMDPKDYDLWTEEEVFRDRVEHQIWPTPRAARKAILANGLEGFTNLPVEGDTDYWTVDATGMPKLLKTEPGLTNADVPVRLDAVLSPKTAAQRLDPDLQRYQDALDDYYRKNEDFEEASLLPGEQFFDEQPFANDELKLLAYFNRAIQAKDLDALNDAPYVNTRLGQRLSQLHRDLVNGYLDWIEVGRIVDEFMGLSPQYDTRQKFIDRTEIQDQRKRVLDNHFSGYRGMQKDNTGAILGWGTEENSPWPEMDNLLLVVAEFLHLGQKDLAKQKATEAFNLLQPELFAARQEMREWFWGGGGLRNPEDSDKLLKLESYNRAIDSVIKDRLPYNRPFVESNAYTLMRKASPWLMYRLTEIYEDYDWNDPAKSISPWSGEYTDYGMMNEEALYKRLEQRKEDAPRDESGRLKWTKASSMNDLLDESNILVDRLENADLNVDLTNNFDIVIKNALEQKISEDIVQSLIDEKRRYVSLYNSNGLTVEKANEILQRVDEIANAIAYAGWNGEMTPVETKDDPFELYGDPDSNTVKEIFRDDRQNQIRNKYNVGERDESGRLKWTKTAIERSDEQALLRDVFELQSIFSDKFDVENIKRAYKIIEEMMLDLTDAAFRAEKARDEEVYETLKFLTNEFSYLDMLLTNFYDQAYTMNRNPASDWFTTADTALATLGIIEKTINDSRVGPRDRTGYDPEEGQSVENRQEKIYDREEVGKRDDSGKLVWRTSFIKEALLRPEVRTYDDPATLNGYIDDNDNKAYEIGNVQFFDESGTPQAYMEWTEYPGHTYIEWLKVNNPRYGPQVFRWIGENLSGPFSADYVNQRLVNQLVKKFPDRLDEQNSNIIQQSDDFERNIKIPLKQWNAVPRSSKTSHWLPGYYAAIIAEDGNFYTTDDWRASHSETSRPNTDGWFNPWGSWRGLYNPEEGIIIHLTTGDQWDEVSVSSASQEWITSDMLNRIPYDQQLEIKRLWKSKAEEAGFPINKVYIGWDREEGYASPWFDPEEGNPNEGLLEWI